MILQRLSLLMLLMCSRPKSGHSALITYPRDTEVLVNQSTYFNCSTSIRSEQIHWYHHRVGENQTNYVYYKGQFNQAYAERYSIEIYINNKTGEYNLIIRSVKPGDSGRYVCQDDGGLGELGSAELIVLDATPTCLSSMKQEGIVGPNSCYLSLEKLHLSCSVSYNGNTHPILQWKMEGNDDPILEGKATDYSGKRATVNLTMSSAIELHGDVFTCGTTRSHDKKLSCTTDAVCINYAVGQPMTLNTAKGETITCSANASVPCTYRWLYNNDKLTQNPVSNDQVLTTNRLGNHSCEASCPIKGINCTFVAMHVVVIEEETSTASEDRPNTKMLIAILISTVVILLIIACVGLLFFRIRKARIKNRAHKPKDMEPSASGEATPLNDDGAEKVTSIAGDNNRTIIKEDENTTKASLEIGKAIAGIAALDDMIYVVSDRSKEVEMYDNTDEFKYRRSVNLVELENPWDLTSCRLKKCLFIMDRRSPTTPNHVIRVDSNVENLVQWSTEDVYGNLSVTSEGNVIITFCESRRLVIYGPDGERINDLSLPEYMIHPSHALKLRKGQFLICHGVNEDNVHRVCILNKNGKIIKSSSTSMDTPSYVAVDDAGWVFVVDQNSSRVCVFSSDLKKLILEVSSERKKLLCPQRLCLNVKTGKVLVVNNNVTEFRRQNGRLLNENYDSGPFLTRSLHKMCSCY